jgi:hypothetical protein
MSHHLLRLTKGPRAPRRTSAIAGACLAVAIGTIAGGTAQAATLPTVTATVTTSTIAVSGALQSGAVNVSSTATSGKEPTVVLIELKPGVSPNEIYALLESNKASKDPNVVSKYGAIVFDAEAGKGTATEVQTVLGAGQYVALNAEGEKSSKWPHTNFAVAASPAPAAIPAAQATEKTIDYGFRGPTVLHVGELVRFENEGNVVHMDLGFPTKSKKAALKVFKGLATGNEKGLEKLVAGPPANFAGPLSSAAFQQEVITAKPGFYVQACFMPTQDGRPHTLLGMERVIKVVK